MQITHERYSEKNKVRDLESFPASMRSFANLASVHSHFAQKPPEIILDIMDEVYVALTIMLSSESVDN